LTTFFQVEAITQGRFVRVVNIGKNHYGDDCLALSMWEIFEILTCAEA
jgi:hypothetical protein